jgi:hypothetical protein
MTADPPAPPPAPTTPPAARVHWPRAAGLLLAALFTGRYLRDASTWTLLDDVNLAVHEAGHVLFMPFGEFLMMLGGSLFQLAVPVVFAGYFLRAHQPFAAAIVLFWVAVNLFNVSIYIGDARARALPLITGDPTSHDWTWLLIQLDVLQHDTRIADFVRRVGVVCYVAAVGFGIRHTFRAPAAAPADGTDAAATSRATPAATANRGIGT